MRMVILVLVVVVPLMSATGVAIGYHAGLRRNQGLGLRSLGLLAEDLDANIGAGGNVVGVKQSNPPTRALWVCNPQRPWCIRDRPGWKILG